VDNRPEPDRYPAPGVPTRRPPDSSGHPVGQVAGGHLGRLSWKDRTMSGKTTTARGSHWWSEFPHDGNSASQLRSDCTNLAQPRGGSGFRDYGTCAASVICQSLSLTATSPHLLPEGRDGLPLRDRSRARPPRAEGASYGSQSSHSSSCGPVTRVLSRPVNGTTLREDASCPPDTSWFEWNPTVGYPRS